MVFGSFGQKNDPGPGGDPKMTETPDELIGDAEAKTYIVMEYKGKRR